MTVTATEEMINHMVNRFLSWKLPENFNPDGGISFHSDYNLNTPWPAKHEPSGTNLLDAKQAEVMVRHMLDGLPALAAAEPSGKPPVSYANRSCGGFTPTPAPADRGAVEALQRNMRETFEAMCAMRDSINEHIPMPSLESDLLQGPETSVFCATVAEAVIAALALPATEVKPLEWNGCEARSDRGDLYSVTRLSENVCALHWNGTSFPGWYGSIDAAKAAAQSDSDDRALAAPPQAREGE